MKVTPALFIMLVVSSASAQSADGASSRTYPLAGQPVDVAVGNVDSDLRSDIVTLTETGSVEVALGSGQGRFQPSLSSPIFAATGARSAHVLALADFNQDRRVDLIAGVNVDPTASVCSAAVMLGRGDGHFQAPNFASTALPAGLDPARIEIAQCEAVVAPDLNRDGRPDVVLTYSFIEAGSGVLRSAINVFLMRVDGTLRAPHVIALDGDYGSRTLAVGDFDGDRRSDLVLAEDLVTAAGPKSHQIEVLLGNGRGGFRKGPKSILAPALAPVGRFKSLAVADFDRDGHRDVAVAFDTDGFGERPDRTSPALLLRGLGNGNFAAPSSFGSTFGNKDLIAGDFDGDCAPDVALINSYDVESDIFHDTRSGRLSVYTGRGNGTFDEPLTLWIAGDPSSVVAGQFDSDGSPELAYTDATYDELTIFTNNRCAPMYSIGDATCRPGFSFSWCF